MVKKIVQSFYPELRDEEVRKFGLLSIIFFLIIGAYWLLRMLKNTIFYTVAFPEVLGWLPNQGRLLQPSAKMWSFLVMFVVVLAYSKLVDKVKKQQLFYVLCSIYGVLFIAFAVVLLLNEWYGPAFVGKIPLAVTGWASYFVVESFGSLVVAVFWSFTNSINDTESAKRGFPLILMVSHIGALLGSAVLLFTEQIGNLWSIFLSSSFVVLSVIPLVRYFMKTTPPEYLVGYRGTNEKVKIKKDRNEGCVKGIFSGITLLFRRPYLLSIFIVTTVHQGIGQIVEYQMQSLASETAEWGSPLAFNTFQGIYGLSINVLGLLITLLGTRIILMRYGIRKSILIFPIIFGLVLIGIYTYSIVGSPTVTHLLWTTFGAMVIVKGIGYAVNNPIKEILYIPTSKDARFKTKSFIETVGARGTKAGGAAINNAFKSSLSELMSYGTLIGLGFVVIWGFTALFAGTKNVEVVKKGEVID